jgi:succinoglycan biosynthesis transport protein ExoP
MSKNIEVLLRAREATALLWSKSIPQESPEVRRPPVPIEPMGRSGEAELVQRVFLLPAEDVPRVVTFCGVGQADGAGGICARAGLLLADQTGSSVCVVEGDFHSPSLHKYLDVENYRGLTDALFESGPIREFVQCSPKTNLFVLPGGSRSGELQAAWNSERLRSRIAELRREFSYVLVYSPQATQHLGGLLLGQIADGVILILESMVTRRETARTAKENLAAANVKILGAVLNNHTFSIPENLYKRL